MNIEVNSERSYLGKDIKAWCMSDTEDAITIFLILAINRRIS